MKKRLLGLAFTIPIIVGCGLVPGKRIAWDDYIDNEKNEYVIQRKPTKKREYNRLELIKVKKEIKWVFDDFNRDGIVDRVYRAKGVRISPLTNIIEEGTSTVVYYNRDENIDDDDEMEDRDARIKRTNSTKTYTRVNDRIAEISAESN